MNTVLFYVQHLLGIGHAFRATRIARALANAGARVHLAWGGSVPRSLDLRGLELTFLEPLRADSSAFERLVALDGTPVTDAHRQRRRDIMQEGRKPQSLANSMAAAQAWYDLMLLHGDPARIRIEATP